MVRTIKKIYQISSWVSLAGLILAIFLVLRSSPPPDLPYDANAAQRAEQKFAAADQARVSGQPAEVQIDPTELNSYLARNLELKGSVPRTPATGSGPASPAGDASGASSRPGRVDPLSTDAKAPLEGSGPQTIEQAESSVKDVKINMEGDLVKAYVLFDFHGKDLSLELDGRLGTEDGYLRFDPVAGKLGSLPLPQSTLDSAVARMMSSPENREKLKLPDDISDIHIVDGKAVVSYK